MKKVILVLMLAGILINNVQADPISYTIDSATVILDLDNLVVDSDYWVRGVGELRLPGTPRSPEPSTLKGEFSVNKQDCNAHKGELYLPGAEGTFHMEWDTTDPTAVAHITSSIAMIYCLRGFGINVTSQ